MVTATSPNDKKNTKKHTYNLRKKKEPEVVHNESSDDDSSDDDFILEEESDQELDGKDYHKLLNSLFPSKFMANKVADESDSGSKSSKKTKEKKRIKPTLVVVEEEEDDVTYFNLQKYMNRHFPNKRNKKAKKADETTAEA